MLVHESPGSFTSSCGFRCSMSPRTCGTAAMGLASGTSRSRFATAARGQSRWRRMNPRRCPTIDTLCRNCELALGHLSASGSRNYMLTFDDTVFAKDFSLMQGIRDKAVMIGGAYPDDCCIVPDENGQFPDLN